jgi:hypothetical protein
MLRSNWKESVQNIEHGIQQSLEALNHYEQRFASLLNSENPSASKSSGDFSIRNEGWNERLAVANERAHAVEELLKEQELVWLEFQKSVMEVRDSLKKSA